MATVRPQDKTATETGPTPGNGKATTAHPAQEGARAVPASKEAERPATGEAAGTRGDGTAPAASKHGAGGLTKYAAFRHKARETRRNATVPGVDDTNIHEDSKKAHQASNKNTQNEITTFKNKSI